MFAETTYAELRPYAAADRLVAVVRCEAIETVSLGTRSERQQARVTVVAAGTTAAAGPAPGTRVDLTRYAQGAALMTRGQTYLVAAYRDARDGPWALLEAKGVAPEAAAGLLSSAQADLAVRLSR